TPGALAGLTRSRHRACYAHSVALRHGGRIVIKSFLAGAIAGGAVVWLWRDDIRAAIDDATGDVRARAAEQLHGVADTLQPVATTVAQGLGGASPPPRGG